MYAISIKYFRNYGDLMKVAIFDFDGTVYKKETFSLLMNQLQAHPVYHSHYNKFYISILPIYMAYKLKLCPEIKMRSFMMKKYLDVFKGLSEEEILTFYTEIAQDMKADFNEEVIARMEEHKRNNVHIMLVSGAFTPLLEAVLVDLPIDEIIGTKIPFKDGLYNPEGELQHVQAKRKNEEIAKALGDKQIDWDNSFAYGDSFSDLSVLEIVGNPVAVDPDKKLQQIAITREWEII